MAVRDWTGVRYLRRGGVRDDMGQRKRSANFRIFFLKRFWHCTHCCFCCLLVVDFRHHLPSSVTNSRSAACFRLLGAQLQRLRLVRSFPLPCRYSAIALPQHADVAVNKILIGNKCDMDEDREVRPDVSDVVP